MSAGYADKLSYRDDLGGQLGAPELQDEDGVLDRKISELATMIKESRNIIVYTGAGISTSCGIPDFRGPNGIWTLQRAKKPLPEFKTTFTFAKPSLTHMKTLRGARKAIAGILSQVSSASLPDLEIPIAALVALHSSGKLRYICSQNVDGLHLRSGIPRACLAELHGNCFAERCPKCRKEYIRDFEIETVGFKKTGRSCTEPGCSGRLKDHILDWEDALPEDELSASEEHGDNADLAICLGTSLQITPACDLPLRTVKKGGKLVIVNLQKTPKDKHATLLVRGRVDKVMKGVMSQLGIPIPHFVRQDDVLLVLRQSQPKRSASAPLPFTIQVCTSHGWRCPVPVVSAVSIEFPDAPSLKESTQRKHPFITRRSLPLARSLRVKFILHLVDQVEESPKRMEVDATFEILGRDSLANPSSDAAEPGGGLPLTLWPENERLNVQVKNVPVNTQVCNYSTTENAKSGTCHQEAAKLNPGKHGLERDMDGSSKIARIA